MAFVSREHPVCGGKVHRYRAADATTGAGYKSDRFAHFLEFISARSMPW